MLSFIDTRTQFVDSCNSLGIDPQITGILSKIIDHTHKSVSVLTDTISLIINRGNGLLPCVEIRCNSTDIILAKTNVGYWECECDLIACGFSLIEKCELDNDELTRAYDTLNMLMCDCVCDDDERY